MVWAGLRGKLHSLEKVVGEAIAGNGRVCQNLADIPNSFCTVRVLNKALFQQTCNKQTVGEITNKELVKFVPVISTVACPAGQAENPGCQWHHGFKCESCGSKTALLNCAATCCIGAFRLQVSP